MRKTTAGIVFLMILTLMCGAALAQTRVLATTFPVYQIVRNITQNVPDVEVQLMLPAQAGCPHDYALTPQDMSKLAQADILVLNGSALKPSSVPLRHAPKRNFIPSTAPRASPAAPVHGRGSGARGA